MYRLEANKWNVFRDLFIEHALEIIKYYKLIYRSFINKKI